MNISGLPADAIMSFSGPYEFLSNFHPSAIVVDGEFYSTVEHAFQAAKTDDPALKADIRDAATPHEAKKKGRAVALVADWEQKKISVMTDLVRAKFKAHLDLKMQLLMTGDRVLVEGNTWKDDFWGVTKKGIGQNHLGKILMDVRTEIRAADHSAFDVLLKFLEEKNLSMLNNDLRHLLAFSERFIADPDSDGHLVNELKEIVGALK